MKVLIHLKEQSKPIKRKGVINAYTKGGLYCLLMKNGQVKKYPLSEIHEITEG